MTQKNSNRKSERRPSFIAFLFALLLFSLFVIACEKEDGQGIEYNFKQGVAELELSLQKFAPPEKLYPNSDFKIIVDVHNLMAYDVESGRIWITGLVDDYFELNPKEALFSEYEEGDLGLQGKSLSNPAGEQIFVEFRGRAHQLFLNAEEYTAPYFLKSEYRSRMEFLDTFCINTHLYAVYDPNCVIQETKAYSGQGAPIAIGNVEEVLTPGAEGGVEFRLKVQNKGSGKIKRMDVVQSKLGGEPITCEFPEARGEYKQSIVFTESDMQHEAILVCRKSLPSEVAYQTPLFVEFAYDYQTQEQHQLRMVR